MAQDAAIAGGHPHSPVGQSAVPAAHGKTNFWTLTLGSVGVVYGDIGTSPLYAMREAVHAASHGGPVTREAVIGVLSLMLWSLIIVVTLKYVVVLLRADNKGEGGTLTLVALAQRVMGKGRGAVPPGVVGGPAREGRTRRQAGPPPPPGPTPPRSPAPATPKPNRSSPFRAARPGLTTRLGHMGVFPEGEPVTRRRLWPAFRSAARCNPRRAT